MPLPRVSSGGELRSVSYNQFDGNMSWIPVANRRQANLDSSGNPLPDVNDSPLTLEDSTKGRKQINIIHDSSCNKISFDSPTLNSTLALYQSRLPTTT